MFKASGISRAARAASRFADPREARDQGLRTLIICALGVSLVVLPTFVYPVFLMKVLCFALFALSFNLLIGYGGMVSFGHAAFFGGGGYVFAYLATEMHLSTGLALVAAIGASALLGALFGWIAVKREGIYFSMTTLALAQMFYFMAVRNPDLTGGENGIQAVPRGTLFGLVNLSNDRHLYVFVAALFFGAFLLMYRVIFSPFGEACRAIRDNEERAQSLGYRVTRYKLLLFVLSAAFAGAAGAMKSMVFQLATLTDVHWSTSGEVILMTLLGGLGTIFGPIVGALIVVSLQNFLAGFGEWVGVFQGLIFIACVMAFREGIVGLSARRAGHEL